MQDPFLHIEDYINGNLSEADLQEFEIALAVDERLRQAVEDFPLLSIIGEAIIEEEISEIVTNELKKKVDTDEPVKRKYNLSSILKWLAVIGLFLVLAWWATKIFDTKTNEEIFAELYSDPNWPLERSGDNDEITIAISEYFTGDSIAAKRTLRISNSTQSRYWLAEIYLKEKEFDSVLTYLPVDIMADISATRDRKLYIEILSLYLSGNLTEAKAARDKLPDDMDAFYLDRVKKLEF